MPHNLAPIDLLYPNGDLPLSLFPDKAEGKTANDALQLWLDEAQLKLDAVADADQSEAARHYVYAKAYRAEALRIGTQPNRQSDGGGPMSVSREWGPDRPAYWDKKADLEELRFAEFVPTETIRPKRPSFRVF
jgi:hypothetical protein